MIQIIKFLVKNSTRGKSGTCINYTIRVKRKKKRERENSKDELNDENARVKRQSTGLKAQRR